MTTKSFNQFQYQGPNAVAEECLGISLPTTLEKLKTAYILKAQQTHPDKGGTAEDFIRTKKAYEFLVSLNGSSNIFETGSEISSQTTTVCGTSLSELGLGLGPTTNGKNCPQCDHKGYEEYWGEEWKVCNKCDEKGMMPKKYPCKYCKGTGRFKQRLGRVVDCYACKGTGRFEHPHHKVRCYFCFGTKTLRGLFGGGERVRLYRKCFKCGGTGEIAIFNPVLPKGRLL